ncbi:hypothetical protein EDD17DRAFT_862410 [Pisolithus thermaeus]|nr:hypothetical protein EDD17DRAFT_862410 [Pisolithus thermaeus]
MQVFHCESICPSFFFAIHFPGCYLLSPFFGNPSRYPYFPPQCNIQDNTSLKMALAQDGRLDLQKDLTSAVEQYQSSGTNAKVNTLIQEAFEMYGDDVDVLCPILVGIAQQNRLYAEPQGLTEAAVTSSVLYHAGNFHNFKELALYLWFHIISGTMLLFLNGLV